MDVTQKTVPPMRYLSTTRRLKIPDIPAFAAEAIGPLFAKASEKGLTPQGPLVFIYNCAEDELDCSIGIPIAGEGSESIDVAPFVVTEKEALRCVSTVYKGSMNGIKQAWDEFNGVLKDGTLKPINESREVYLHWVDFDSDENLTELQIGLQA